MSTVRWAMYRELVLKHPEVDLHIQYGAKTSVTRKSLHLPKAHANDAYCIGSLHPKHRIAELVYQKKRRNNRILAKFYDAKYIDIRDGKKKSGLVLSCGRNNRRESRHSDKNQRIYRGQKCSAGRVQIRKHHYQVGAGDVVVYKGARRIVKGLHSGGKNAEFTSDGIKPQSASVSKLRILRKKGGWQSTTAHAVKPSGTYGRCPLASK